MKERYNIEISGIQLTVVSDENEDFVNSIVARIDERVNDMVVRNKRCSKLDAALLCALDYCGEAAKAEKRIRNLEAQISLYDANLKRMREELAASQNASPAVKSALGIADAKSDAQTEQSEDQTDEIPAAAEENAANEAELAETAEEITPAAAKAPTEGKRSKLEQIEMLLRSGND